MPEKLEVLDLPANLSHHVQTADLLPVQDLHSHLVLGQLMLAHCGIKNKKNKNERHLSNTNYNTGRTNDERSRFSGTEAALTVLLAALRRRTELYH